MDDDGVDFWAIIWGMDTDPATLQSRVYVDSLMKCDVPDSKLISWTALKEGKEAASALWKTLNHAIYGMHLRASVNPSTLEGPWVFSTVPGLFVDADAAEEWFMLDPPSAVQWIQREGEKPSSHFSHKKRR